jgi:hypothetical protein
MEEKTYFKNRYEKDEEFRNKMKEIAMNNYNKKRLEIMDKINNDEDYRNKRREIVNKSAMKYRQKKKEEKIMRGEEIRPRGGTGRPKGSKNKKKKEDENNEEIKEVIIEPKKRGRPVGSKNKVHIVDFS